MFSGAGEPQCVEEDATAGIAEKGSTGGDDDGKIDTRYVELAEHRLRVRIRFEIQPFGREPVAGQDFEQSPGIGREARSDQGQTGTDLREDGVAEQKGPENQLAQIELLGHDDT